MMRAVLRGGLLATREYPGTTREERDPITDTTATAPMTKVLNLLGGVDSTCRKSVVLGMMQLARAKEGAKMFDLALYLL
jgi:hypothetical protein